MLISVKLLTKYIIIIYALGSVHEKFGVWTGLLVTHPLPSKILDLPPPPVLEKVLL